MSTTDIGRKGEELACSYFENYGYEILAKRYRSHRGEIDIVAAKGEELHFIEVKTRCTKGYGEPEEAIDKNKLSRMFQTALKYIEENDSGFSKFIFDVVGIKLDHMEGVI